MDGRYQVTWPWINEDVKPPENYELSLGSLKSLYQRLADNPDLLQQNAFIKDQLSKNTIEELNGNQEEGENKHYIPNHAVISPDKDTTKVRMV